MTENLQNALSDLISKTLNGIDATTGFLQEEIPEVVQQLLMWHGVYNFIVMCTSFILVGVSYILYNEIKKETGKEGMSWTTEDEEWVSISFCKVSLLVLTILVMLIISLSKFNIVWLQIWIAPKIFLIEYMASLVK